MLDPFHPRQQVPVPAGDPTDAQPGEAVRLGHDAERKTQRVNIDRLRQATRRVAFEQTIDLVAEQVDVTLPAQRHHGISAFIVEKDTPGLIVGNEEDKMGLRASDTTDLILNDCIVPAENRLGNEGDGFKIAMKALDGGRIGIAAQSVGVAQAAFDAAVKYAKKREQFGRPISKFQGLRWMIADMATEIEAARQLMLSAAAMKDRGEKIIAQASMAKLFASEMVNRVTAKALQIHGGYGFIKDYPVERFYRDARVFTIYEGTSEIQRVVISNHILKDKRRPSHGS